MTEEVSPESKVYVKEEIDKMRKEFKEDLKEANSRATKTFATIALIVGLLGSLGIYGLVTSAISNTTFKKLESEAQLSLNKVVEYEKDANKALTDILFSKIIVGMIVPYGGVIIETTNGDPYEVGKGWFFCNGASLDRNEYKDLFNVIGKAFGAPDSDSFNLPDLRGRFVRGVDVGDPNEVNWRDPDHNLRSESASDGNEGNKVGSLQEDALKKHKHKYVSPIQASSVKSIQMMIGTNITKSQEWETTEYGESENETRPKNVYVNWIIKAK